MQGAGVRLADRRQAWQVTAARHVAAQVNGGSSKDAQRGGWGAAGGFVYQRGYVEFFCSPDAFKAFVRDVQAHGTQSYMAANSQGDFFSDADCTAAVAWGAFPGSEVQQPLVTCTDGFQAWAEEAFSLWTSMWGAVVEDGSEAATFLADVGHNWLLVSLLESDFVAGDVFRMFAT